MPKKLFLDIETIPAPDSANESLEYLYQKKLEKKAKRKQMSEEALMEENPDGFDDFYRGTSFDGSFGQVLCIAYAIDDSPIKIICHDKNEKKTIEEFWEIAKDVNLFIGHNVIDFDMRFIYQRSVILGVRPSKDLSFARYRSAPMFDTMREWGKWAFGQNVGLEHLALALGIPTPKEGIDGSQVADFYQAGKVKEICDYCMRDVEVTRRIYNKMNFIF